MQFVFVWALEAFKGEAVPKFWHSYNSCTKIWYSCTSCDKMEMLETCNQCLYGSQMCLKVQLYQNYGTAALAVPKFATAAPKFGTSLTPVTKLKCGKHAFCVCMGPSGL